VFVTPRWRRPRLWRGGRWSSSRRVEACRIVELGRARKCRAHSGRPVLMVHVKDVAQAMALADIPV
jgi:hypothetical protein